MTNIAELMRESAAVVKANEFTVDDLPSAFQDDPSGYLDGLAERLEQAAAEMERAEPVAWLWMREGRGSPVAASLAWREGSIPLYRHPPTSAVPEGMVQMPTTADQAQGMYLVAYHWLRANAPDRLSAAPQGGSDSE